MLNLRKTVLICLIGVLIFSTNLFAAEFTIRIAANNTADHAFVRASEVFKKYIDEITKGRIKVEVHHSGSLGSARENIEMLRMGTLETTVAGVSHFQRHIPELGILVLPFLWKDSETLFQTLDGAVGQYLDTRYDAMGFHNLGYMDVGFRSITNNRRPIMSVADMKGLKIRTLPTPVHIAFFKALGASPTPMDPTEMFEALRTGVIDAQENPPAVVYTFRMFEVQKYYSLTRHANEPGCFAMSKIFYNKLPGDLRIAVDTAGKRASLWQRKANDEDNEKFLKTLKDKGMQINTLSETNSAEFRKIALQSYSDAIKGLGKTGADLTDLIIWSNK
jgi:TRAP-type transport system periplasmic protein